MLCSEWEDLDAPVSYEKLIILLHQVLTMDKSSNRYRDPCGMERVRLCTGVNERALRLSCS